MESLTLKCTLPLVVLYELHTLHISPQPETWNSRIDVTKSVTDKGHSLSVFIVLLARRVWSKFQILPSIFLCWKIAIRTLKKMYQSFTSRKLRACVWKRPTKNWNGDKWYRNILGKFPENLEIVEFPKVNWPSTENVCRRSNKTQMERLKICDSLGIPRWVFSF